MSSLRFYDFRTIVFVPFACSGSHNSESFPLTLARSVLEV